MGRKFLFLGVLIFGGFISSAPALAYNTQLIIYATVPPMRAIYLDASGNVVKVAGNTTDNIMPTVYDAKNQTVPMNDTAQKQYQNFLRSQGDKLIAGKTYNVNPLSVNTLADNQKIQINLSINQISLSL